MNSNGVGCSREDHSCARLPYSNIAQVPTWTATKHYTPVTPHTPYMPMYGHLVKEEGVYESFCVRDHSLNKL